MSRLLAVVVAVVAVLGVLGVSPVAAQEGERSWLALGDSYSSGEGIPGTVPVGQDGVNGGPNAQGQGRDCRRATGEGTDATAWAVGAFDELTGEEKGLEHLDFVACTGATLDEAAGQIGEASEATGRDQWDLVTFSFGGNNIGFVDVIYDCLGIGSTWGTFDGCDISERQLRRRVDMLTGQTDIGGGYQGSLTLPALLDLLAANQVVPGGDVIVVGYPHLVEEVDRWDRWRREVVRSCEGIKRRDVAMLRSVTGYLNEQIFLTVLAADQRHRADGVRFHFLDISQDPYEYSGNRDHRHGLCSDDPWLNGVTTGITAGDLDIRLDSQFHNSFHPNQTGHTNTARVLAAYLRDNVTFDDLPESDGFGVTDLAECESSQTPALNAGPDGFALAAVCTYLAWQAGDRDLAERFADPPAVEAIFGLTPGVDWRFNGCVQDPSRVGGDRGSWLGWMCTFTEPAAGELHGVLVEFTFTAYDDVFVVGDVYLFG